MDNFDVEVVMMNADWNCDAARSLRDLLDILLLADFDDYNLEPTDETYEQIAQAKFDLFLLANAWRKKKVDDETD